MKENNIILTKSENFTVRIVNLYIILYFSKNERVMSRQLLKSGTSIGANINEAVCGISKNDFLAKMYIAFKECNESLYWLRLLFKTEFINEREYNSIIKDCSEIKNILSSITKTTSDS